MWWASFLCLANPQSSRSRERDSGGMICFWDWRRLDRKEGRRNITRRYCHLDGELHERGRWNIEHDGRNPVLSSSGQNERCNFFFFFLLQKGHLWQMNRDAFTPVQGRSNYEQVRVFTLELLGVMIIVVMILSLEEIIEFGSDYLCNIALFMLKVVNEVIEKKDVQLEVNAMYPRSYITKWINKWSTSISSVECQKGAITIQRRSVENQKGAIAVQSLRW